MSSDDLPNFMSLDNDFWFFFFLNLTPELIHKHLTNRDMENKRWILKQPELTFLEKFTPNDEDTVSCDNDDYDEIMIHGLEDDESRS